MNIPLKYLWIAFLVVFSLWMVLPANAAQPLMETSPSANFTSNVTSGVVNLSVAFSDLSSDSRNIVQIEQANGCENGTTVWFEKRNAAVLSSSTEQAHSGTRSLKIVTNNTTTSEGGSTRVHYTLAITVVPSTTYTVSLYIMGSGTLKLYLRELNSAGENLGDTLVAGSPITLTGEWVRYNITRSFGANGVGAVIFFATPLQSASTFYIDDIQLEAGSSSTLWKIPPRNHPTSWLWDFSDGFTNTTQNPTHVFTSAGVFNVSLTSTNSIGSNTSIKSITVNAAPTPSFTSNVTCGIVPFSVQFNDTSSGVITDYYWDFTNGNTSTDQNPIANFTVPGVYGIDHSITLNGNTLWKNETGYITVRAVGDTCEATAKRYSTQMNSDSTMVYVVAICGFMLFVIVFAMVIRRK